MTWENVYLDLCERAMLFGHAEETRVGRAYALLGQSITVDPGPGKFPLLTTRRVYPKPVLGELEAFMGGARWNREFTGRGCNYWTPNAMAWPRNKGRPESKVEVGKVYGYQWRNFDDTGTDQLQMVRDLLRKDPQSRRMVMSTWNPAQLEDMCLPPCHLLVQFHVQDEFLHASVYMRSVDLALGLPADIILYYALLVYMAHDAGRIPGKVHWHFGNAHLYEVHKEGMTEQLKRDPTEPPDYRYEPLCHPWYHRVNLQFNNYNPQEAIGYALLV